MFSFCNVIFCLGQKYVLIDKTMMTPLQYSDEVSLKSTYNNIFVVEQISIKEFVLALDKIKSHLASENKKTDNLNFIIGNTKIRCIKFFIKGEERLDVMLNTYCKDITVSMHLVHIKNTIRQGDTFVNSWINYILSGMKIIDIQFPVS